MSFFVSDNLKTKIDIETFSENNLPNLKFFLDEVSFNIKKINFKRKGIFFKIKGQSADIENIYFKNYQNCHIGINNSKISLNHIEIKSIDNLLDHDNTIKYIIKIKAKTNEE